MQDLRLIGVHEDGEHLLLAGDEGERFRVPIDDQLRVGVREHHSRPASGPDRADGGLRPRDVQALIRGGCSAEEAAEEADWSIEKVHRYEGPILAEREHVAGLARAVSVRGRAPGGGTSVQSVESRVSARLADRGVPADSARWDAWRRETGPWTVVAVFPAGGRERRASWHFDPVNRALTALDDEARWLSGDEQEPIGGPIPVAAAPRRKSRVYDVEAEGGLRPATSDDPSDSPDAPTDAPAGDEPVDLMTAMRQRSAARGRRGSGRKSARRKAQPRTSPTHVPGAEDAPDDALPLEDIAYDPATMPPPPGAHAEPPDDHTSGPGRAPGPGAGARFEEPGLFDHTEAAADHTGAASETTAAADEQAAQQQAAPRDGSESAQDQPTQNRPTQNRPAQDRPADNLAPAASVTEEPEESPSTSRRSARKSGRPSVPSWDDIMFGVPRSDS